MAGHQTTSEPYITAMGGDTHQAWKSDINPTMAMDEKKPLAGTTPQNSRSLRGENSKSSPMDLAQLWMTFIALDIGIIFGVFSALSWQATEQSRFEANDGAAVANQLSLLQYCSTNV
jgi:hypothetical protein